MGNPCSGIILAGGLSTRFSGRNKAFIEIGGIKILDRLHALYRELFDEIILVTNDPHRYVDWDMLITTDIFQVRSSLTGIHAGLSAASNPHAFVAACDTPFLNRGLVEEVIGRIEPRFDVVIPKTREGFEPLCAAYARRCIAPMERSLAKGDFKISRLFNKLKVRTVSEKVVLAHDPEMTSFFNVNTPEDLEKARKIHQGGTIESIGE
jgi:molybdopterin-guanine dinucleotide biosynthesis protein A